MGIFILLALIVTILSIEVRLKKLNKKVETIAEILNEQKDKK
ncbi:hypothetical protein ACUXCC_004666 [Cytobacillus horneckiae]|nr:hypothetical protein [Cytobacillus horneckiae]